jgi:hypothetical protein
VTTRDEVAKWYRRADRRSGLHPDREAEPGGGKPGQGRQPAGRGVGPPGGGGSESLRWCMAAWSSVAGKPGIVREVGFGEDAGAGRSLPVEEVSSSKFRSTSSKAIQPPARLTDLTALE